MRRLLASLAASVLLVSVPLGAQTASSTRHFLWKVQSARGIVYLAGSVHALSADIYPLDPAFQRAFDGSGTLVEEIDLGNELGAGLAALGKGVFQDGRTFDQAVSKDTAAAVTARLKDTVPPQMLQSMKPWMVDMMLEATGALKEGLDPNLGLDKYFFDRATAIGKPVQGLETAESQIDRLDQMPPAVQEQMLRSTLRDLDAEPDGLRAIVAQWRRGDAPGLEKSLLAGFKEFPAAYKSLLVDRNREWMPKIEACFSKPMPCFVVVGAAHLVGPDGLIAMMQKRGYRIEQQ